MQYETDNNNSFLTEDSGIKHINHSPYMHQPNYISNITELPSLHPINISSVYELYIGVKNSGTEHAQFAHEYDGARLSFDLDNLDFCTVSGTEKHSNN